MSGNVALDVVIGLIFVFLLYSLFATVLAEIIATLIGLRARNLKEGVDRMLNDEDDWVENMFKEWSVRWRWLSGRSRAIMRYLIRFALYFADRVYRLVDSMRLMKNPDNLLIKQFYDHPEIKYLGSTGVFQNPSSFKAISFSKTLLYLLNGTGPVVADNIERALRSEAQHIVGRETQRYVISLWEDSQGDLVKFKLQLEAWFDRTMEQCTEWYKRKIQVILLMIGFGIAWTFNADTFVIVKKLSTDKDAREKMVNLASAYLENNPDRPSPFRGVLAQGDTTVSLDSLQRQWDTLIAVRKSLEDDMKNANTVLGLGGWLPDSISVTTPMVYAGIEPRLLPKQKQREIEDADVGEYVAFAFKDKISYFFKLAGHHFFGFLIMAIAISLGAPFWFDLLNKMMKLRTSVKQETDTAKYSATLHGQVSPLDREG